MNCVIHGDVQSWKDARFTEQSQQLEQAGTDRPASGGDARGVDQQGGLDAAGFGGRAQGGLDLSGAKPSNLSSSSARRASG